MRQFVPVPDSRVIKPSIFTRILDGITRAIDAALNRVFSLTHRASVTRWNALGVGFILAWLFSMVMTVPEDIAREQLRQVFLALGGFAAGNPQSFVIEVGRFIFAVVLHPAVIKHALALYAPFWLMHRVTAIYLADIFEEPIPTAQHFVMEAAFGRGYSTIHIRQGAVAEQDLDSTIVKIGGPGYVEVDLDSAILFERPDGTPHVILPGKKEIIDDFERIRRVVDVRDSVETIDLAPTRTRDGIFVGAKNIQFSYSLYRGETPDRKQTPYPCNPTAVENLVYKDGRAVKPGIAPPRTPEWQSGQFKMGGPIMGEIGGFIGKRSLSDFLAAIGEPEEKSLFNREQEIEKTSQNLAGVDRIPTNKLPLEAPKDFATRNVLTEAFYSHDDFVKRMAAKGFQLNWIGVGTWHAPAEIISANHREAWKISRENLARGSKAALDGVKTETALQEMVRIIQALPIGQFFKNFESLQNGDEQPLDDLLQEYEEIMQRAADLYLRGLAALDFRFIQLVQEARRLLNRISRPTFSDYDLFLQQLAGMADDGYYIFDTDVEELLQRAAGLFETLKAVLKPEDSEFLLAANRLHVDLLDYQQIMRVVNVINSLRHSQHGDWQA